MSSSAIHKDWGKDGMQAALLAKGAADCLFIAVLLSQVAGTRQGITAIQLDTKLPGLDVELLVAALTPAAAARHKLLDAMEAALATAEAAADDRARPQHGSIEINKELLPRLIGVQVGAACCLG